MWVPHSWGWASALRIISISPHSKKEKWLSHALLQAPTRTLPQVAPLYYTYMMFQCPHVAWESWTEGGLHLTAEGAPFQQGEIATAVLPCPQEVWKAAVALSWSKHPISQPDWSWPFPLPSSRSSCRMWRGKSHSLSSSCVTAKKAFPALAALRTHLGRLPTPSGPKRRSGSTAAWFSLGPSSESDQMYQQWTFHH